MLDTGEKGRHDMKKDIEYTDAPKDIEESLDRAVIIQNFELTPEKVAEFASKRVKKPVSIYLSVETIEKFKAEAKKMVAVIRRLLAMFSITIV